MMTNLAHWRDDIEDAFGGDFDSSLSITFFKLHQNSCYDLRPKNVLASQDNNHEIAGSENPPTAAHQYHAQESLSGVDSSKHKFRYTLAAPISVATKLTEDTMTYLNQGQAYEIKLENITDVSEAKKGFMCSIINIGFQERHLQQAENELWQQWGQQRPSEKIFSVDMKLSYNVFGVESDGLNKYEFLWDSSKVAGVFIRINSISTEFTPKKHGGEKGVPFKLSIETFSYNSKTHDSYFISAGCCQIKVFKPKGAERKIRSDRDKIFKRPSSEQEKYHRSCDYTTFKECSLTSLHPMAEGSLCYYRHSHGHFASKQSVSNSNSNVAQSISAQASATPNHNEEDLDNQNNARQTQSNDNQQPPDHIRSSSENETDSSGHMVDNRRDYQIHSDNRSVTSAPGKFHQIEYPARSLSHNQYSRSSVDNSDYNNTDLSYGHQFNQQPHSELHFNHSNDLLQLPQTSAFNQIYHGNPVRNVAGLAGINNSQHFGMAYYGHTLPTPIPTHIPPSTSFGAPVANPLTSYSNTHNYSDCSQHYDTDLNASMKNHTNHSNNQLPSSCYSRSKDSSSAAMHEPQASKPIDSDEYKQITKLTISSSCADVISWFAHNRFGQYTKTFGSFSGSDLFRLSRTELIEICGFIDGIRLYNSLHNQPIKPRRVLYVSYKFNDIFHPIHLYEVTLRELLDELANMLTLVSRTKTGKRSIQMRDDSSEAQRKRSKLASSSNSSNDSGSPAEPQPNGTTVTTYYYQNDRYFSEIEAHDSDKCSGSSISLATNSNYSHESYDIARLLVEGIASVKIVATDRMIQTLEDESMWTLTYDRETEEACITCQSVSKRPSD